MFETWEISIDGRVGLFLGERVKFIRIGNVNDCYIVCIDYVIDIIDFYFF